MTRVVIVGAGPVGMVCALALHKRGIPVSVFEQEPEPVKDQRAASIHPSTLDLLDELSVTEKIIPLGLVSKAYRFHDRVTNAVVAEFDLDRMRDEFRFPFVLQYEQYKLTASIAAEYAGSPDFDVRFSHCVTGLSQTADGVEVEVASPSGKERLQAAYVIGCDGGRSSVRKFADIEFVGLRIRNGSSRLPPVSISQSSIQGSFFATISRTRRSGAISSRFAVNGRRDSGAQFFRPAPTRRGRLRHRPIRWKRDCRNSFRRRAATRSNTSMSMTSINGWRKHSERVASCWREMRRT